MSCFFCNSIYHVSFNCDIYPTNKLRKKFICSIDHCRYCLSTVDVKGLLCPKCEFNEKCFICFSKLHHSIYCPDRFNVSQISLPKIDQNLLCRFIQLLTFEEIYFMAFSYPYILDLITLKPLKIKHHEILVFPRNKDYINGDLIFVDKVLIEYIYMSPISVLNLANLESVIFYVRHLDIKKTEVFSNEILKLLSIKTKFLKCGETEFHPNLTFREIIEVAPNLEFINLFQTNVEMSDTWPNVLWEFDNNKNFKQLHLKIPAFNFDLKSVADFMKKKYMTEGFMLHLYINSNIKVDHEIYNYLKNEYPKSFQLLYIQDDSFTKSRPF